MDPMLRTGEEAKTFEFPWGQITWLANGDIGNSEKQTVGKVVIRSGHSNPPHRHGNCEEILHLLRGSLAHAIGTDEVVHMTAGDTLTVPAGVSHHATTTSDEDAVMMVCYSSPRREMG